MTPVVPSSAATRPVLVWDLPTRLFHGSLAATVATAVVSAQLDALGFHMRCGLAVLVLVLFRLAWGMVGSQTARFADFVAAPRVVVAHARALRLGAEEASVGHNPLGGLMVVALLGLLAAQAATGLFAKDDVFTEGPLASLVSSAASGRLTGLHKLLFVGLAVAVAAHVAAVAGYLWLRGENLVRPMLTGVKSLPAAVPAPWLASPWRAAGAAAAAVAAVAALLRLA